MEIMRIYCQCCASVKKGEQNDPDYNTLICLTLIPSKIMESRAQN